MPKVVENLAQYWSDIAAKAGLDADKARQVAELLSDPQMEKTIRDNFKPLPEYSYDLNAVREKTAKETADSWLAANQEKIDRANAVLQAANGNNPTQQAVPAGLTKDEIAALVEERAKAMLAPRDQNYLDYVDITNEYRDTFGKTLSRAEFEKFVGDNRDKLGNVSLKQAYKEYIAPEVEKQREAGIAKRIEAARQEGRLEGFTQRGVPTDSGPKEFSPLFDAKHDVLKMDEMQQAQHSREAFMQGLREGLNKPA